MKLILDTLETAYDDKKMHGKIPEVINEPAKIYFSKNGVVFHIFKN